MCVCARACALLHMRVCPSLRASAGTNKVLGGVAASIGVGPTARALGGIEGSVDPALPTRDGQARPEVVYSVRQLVEKDVFMVPGVVSGNEKTACSVRQLEEKDVFIVPGVVSGKEETAYSVRQLLEKDVFIVPRVVCGNEETA